MTDHDRIEELLALRALGGAEPEDAEELHRALAAHDPGCATCARLQREIDDAVADLAMSLDPVPVREGVEDAVVARSLAVRGARTSAPRRRRTSEAERAPGEVLAMRRRAPAASAWRRVGLVAAAAVLVAAGWTLREITLADPEGPPPAFLAEAAIVPLRGEVEAARLAVAYRPGRPGGYVVATGLPSTSEDRVYELWLFEGDEPARAGCFSPEDGEVVAEIDGDVASADLLAVTVESTSCPSAPTTEPIATGTPTPTPSPV